MDHGAQAPSPAMVERFRRPLKKRRLLFFWVVRLRAVYAILAELRNRYPQEILDSPIVR